MPLAEDRIRAFMVLGKLDQHDGRPVLELADPIEISERFTLWPGLPPAESSFHPGLAPVLFTGRLDGEPVWIEARLTGLSLEQLGSELTPDMITLILMDVCDILKSLHDLRSAHGDIRALNTIVGSDGWVMVTGAGVHKGYPDADLAAVIRMGRKLVPQGSALRLPETAPPNASSLLTELARQLGLADPDDIRRRLGALVRAQLPIIIPQALPRIRVMLEGTTLQGSSLDEVGVELGPDGDLTGSDWSNSGAEVTREAGAPETTEGTSTSWEDTKSSRVQILARLLAPPVQAPDPDRFKAHEGNALEALRKQIDNDILDPILLPGENLQVLRSTTPPAGLPPQPSAPAVSTRSPTSLPRLAAIVGIALFVVGILLFATYIVLLGS